MVSLNGVYQFVNENTRIRIIFIDHERNQCAYVFLTTNTSMPVIASITGLEENYKNNLLVEIYDPYFIMHSDNNLSEIEIKKRDSAWRIVEKYWETKRNELIFKETRNKVLSEISMDEGMPVISVKRIFSRFWQRGMNKNTLLPDYSNSGARGQNKPLSIKNGRKRIYGDSDVEGVIVTDLVRKQFEVATDKYWYNQKKKSLREVYRLMLADFYSFNLESDSSSKIIVKSSIPTFAQYYYWFKKNTDFSKAVIEREGQKAFELKHRPLLNDSRTETPGPGFRYQIDSTIADIHIVSEIDRNQIIGRPNVYIVIDVFSRIITGVYVGLESSSWKGAMMVLDSMVADKVEFCEKYNIIIEKEDWPCNHLPEIIIADRGEMEGYCANNLIQNLNITIENTSPYRGDLKGIVERFFRTMNEKIMSFLPGAVMTDYRKRGDPDYRLDAKLTLKEITEVLIRHVLLHNIHEVEKYQLTTEMIRDNVKPIPLDLWNWGIENKKGCLRKVDRNIFRVGIMPRGKAKMTRGAIVFKERLFYGSAELLTELNKTYNTTNTVNIIYDPRNVDKIFVLKEDGRQFIEMNLLERSREFAGKCLEDVIFMNKKERQLRQSSQKSQLQLEIEFENTVKKIAASANKETEKTRDKTLSKAERIGNIRANRAAEQRENRKMEAFTSVTNTNSVEAEIVPFIVPAEDIKGYDTEKQEDFNKRIMEKIISRRRK